MKSSTYYLVSYYARLKGNGFGFGREYIKLSGSQLFSPIVFERMVATQAGLSEQDINVITRVEVSEAEYDYNMELKNGN